MNEQALAERSRIGEIADKLAQKIDGAAKQNLVFDEIVTRLRILAPTIQEKLDCMSEGERNSTLLWALDGVSLEECARLEETDPYLISLRKQREEREKHFAIQHAEATRIEDTAHKVMKELGKRL